MERRDRIKIRVDNKDYDVVGGSFQELLAAVKALPNRRFLGDQKIWVVATSFETVQGQLENSGFTLEGGTPAPDDAPPPSMQDQIRAQVGGYQLTLAGASFQDLLSAVKAIPGRRFDGDNKIWLLPGTLSEVKAFLGERNIRIMRTAEPEQLDPVDDVTTSPATTASPLPPPPPDEDFWSALQSDTEEMTDEFEPPLPSDAELPPLDSGSDPTLSNSASIANYAPSKRENRRPDQIRVQVGTLHLVVTGGSFQAMLEAVKAIPERRFDPQQKSWILPDDINSVQQHIRAAGFILEEAGFSDEA